MAKDKILGRSAYRVVQAIVKKDRCVVVIKDFTGINPKYRQYETTHYNTYFCCLLHP